MGWRFHRVLNIIPGLRINVSKSGLSGSVGPRGADLNIGRHGVTTNAGIPGTGISYRSKMGSHGSKFGVLALVAALGFAAFKNGDRITSLFQHPPTSVASAAKTLTAPKRELAAQNVALHRLAAGGGGTDKEAHPATRETSNATHKNTPIQGEGWEFSRRSFCRPGAASCVRLTASRAIFCSESKS